MRSIILASFLFLIPSTALADDSLVGQPAPDFAGARIFREDGKRKLSDYRGEVVLVVFFCTICKTQWIEGPVEGLLEKYGARGFAVLGYLGGETEINDQTAGKARDYVRDMDFTVFFGADLSSPGTVEPFQGYRAGKRPHCFLIDADGNVAWSGTPGVVSVPEPEIEKLLAARAAGIASRHPDAPATILEALRAGRIAKAYEIAAREGLEPLAAEIGGGARKRLARANALHEARDFAAALAMYQALASSWRDTDIADAAEEKIRAYRTPEMRRELAAYASLHSLEQKLANANADNAQRARAYREFAKRAEGTAAADRANDFAAALEE